MLTLRKKTLLYTILICFVVSCQANGLENVNNEASLQDVTDDNTQSCLPPCWEGIRPGRSTETEVISVLNQLEEQGRIKSYEAINIGNYRVYLASGDIIKIFFIDQYVYWINGLVSNSPLTVSQVISQFGNPEGYLSDAVSSKGGDCSGWNSVEAYPVPRGPAGFIIYASQGLTFRVRKSERWPGLICPDVLVTEFDYYEPRPLDSIFEEDGRPALSGLPYGPENMIPWHGYGDGY